jgi:hypothetical protein
MQPFLLSCFRIPNSDNMPHVPPPPALVIRPQDELRSRWRDWMTIALFWLASILVAVAITWIVRENVPTDAAAQLKNALDRNADLQQRVAVLDRAQQVANAGNADLQRAIGEKQEEIAGLRADLAFYSSLTRADAKREGLSVQGLSLVVAPGNPRLYHFTLTLTQNLKPGQVASGQVKFSVEGVRADKLVTLDGNDLAGVDDAKEMGFSFKYFQQIKGTLLLPEGFTPNSVHVEADAGKDFGKSSRDFTWVEALAAPGGEHVGQSK